MVEINVLTSAAFSLNGETLQRHFTTYINRAGDVIIKHLRFRYSINLGDISNITVDGEPATLEAILKTAYNFSCACDEGGVIPPPFKIFDATFDPTFN